MIRLRSMFDVLFSALDPKCPMCSARRLRWVQFVRATQVIDGRRRPTSWSDHECARCTSRLRCDTQTGQWFHVEEREWLAMANDPIERLEDVELEAVEIKRARNTKTR